MHVMKKIFLEADNVSKHSYVFVLHLISMNDLLLVQTTSPTIEILSLSV